MSRGERDAGSTPAPRREIIVKGRSLRILGPTLYTLQRFDVCTWQLFDTRELASHECPHGEDVGTCRTITNQVMRHSTLVGSVQFSHPGALEATPETAELMTALTEAVSRRRRAGGDGKGTTNPPPEREAPIPLRPGRGGTIPCQRIPSTASR